MALRRLRPVFVLGLLALGACVSAPSPTPQAQPSWTRVALPTGLDPVTVTPLGDRLLVGASSPSTDGSATSTDGTTSSTSGTRPAMVTLTADGVTAAVPLAPHSPYAPEAAWTSVTSDGTRVLAIGGARGGAHANVRWTVWSGTAAGVDELPQDFWVFGGWGAGDLVGAVITPLGEALVGTWGGARAGLDAVAYPRTGDAFTRQDPAGTALESTPELLVGPRSVTAAGDGIVVSGSAIHLGAGTVAQLAAVWRSSRGPAGWQRVDLPDSGGHSEAASASCQGAHCVVVGHVDGVLARWSLDDDAATRMAAVPRIAVGDNDSMPAPLVVHGHDVQLVADGGQVVALTREDSGWRRSAGPAGRPVEAALVGERLYVVVAGTAGTPATLWQSDTRTWG